jgi:hypothetical protein
MLFIIKKGLLLFIWSKDKNYKEMVPDPPKIKYEITRKA